VEAGDRDAPRRESPVPGPQSLLFVNASQVVTCSGPPRARRGREMDDAGVV